jgi:CBS domain-containing protein
MYKAKDVMCKEVVSISSDSTVEQAIRILLDNNISGAPVVDDNGNLIGIISEFRLLEPIYQPELRSAPITEFMTRDVLTVTEDTMLSDVVSILVVQRIRRVPVVRDGRLVGLVSRPDLIRYVLESGDEIAEFMVAAISATG